MYTHQIFKELSIILISPLSGILRCSDINIPPTVYLVLRSNFSNSTQTLYDVPKFKVTLVLGV